MNTGQEDCVCDRCSAEGSDEDMNDGPLGEWEGCVLCDRCLGEVEEGSDL